MYDANVTATMGRTGISGWFFWGGYQVMGMRFSVSVKHLGRVLFANAHKIRMYTVCGLEYRVVRVQGGHAILCYVQVQFILPVLSIVA